MNKQELIDYCNAIKENKSQIINCIDVNGIIKKIEQLDEPQKVTVPQFVADLIEYAKIRDWDLEDVFLNIANELDTSEISEWFYTQGNMDVIARAWLDGYEVEKEKRYLVKMKGISSNICYLNRVGNKWIIAGINEHTGMNIYTKHTKKELEEAGFGWIFSCEGIEVEEVE